MMSNDDKEKSKIHVLKELLRDINRDGRIIRKEIGRIMRETLSKNKEEQKNKDNDEKLDLF